MRPLTALLPFVVLAGPSVAATNYCSRPLDGEWVIASYRFDEVSAVSDKEARKLVGSNVHISKDEIQFAITRCHVKRVTRQFASKDEIELMPDLSSHPVEINVECEGRTVIPGFYVGTACDTAFASLDGATYVMRRRR